jgi:hypothetical protein
VVLASLGFAAFWMIPSRQPTLKNQTDLHSVLNHQSIDFGGLAKIPVRQRTETGRLRQ